MIRILNNLIFSIQLSNSPKMKWILRSGIFFFTSFLFSQQFVSKKDSVDIVSILFKQQSDWNRGDIDAFMEGYIKSDQLVFSGASGPIYGWTATRDRYKKTYPSRVIMGVLKFDVLNLISLSSKVIQLQGKFHLTREIENGSGFFTLTWLKVEKKWLIISDHTSSSK